MIFPAQQKPDKMRSWWACPQMVKIHEEKQKSPYLEYRKN